LAQVERGALERVPFNAAYGDAKSLAEEGESGRRFLVNRKARGKEKLAKKSRNGRGGKGWSR